MSDLPVIAIFDVGKTNKKLFLFDDQYKIVHEHTTQFAETLDEDGDPCEDLGELASWSSKCLNELRDLAGFDVKAINFSGYGASLVHIDSAGQPILPLYNYLKPYPDQLKQDFYTKYGGELAFSTATASPVLGNLNSGMQLYRLKYEKPEIFSRITTSLHLPQYLSFLVTGKRYSDITSIGCHTNLWNFAKHRYHDWVYREGVYDKLAPLYPSDDAMVVDVKWKKPAVGAGLHDSSAALIPYLASFQNAFILISTGTWCISLNPFNPTIPTEEELQQDCLCYMTYQGEPVKASRLFAGYEHEQETKKLAAFFNKSLNYFETLEYDPDLVVRLRKRFPQAATARKENTPLASSSPFKERALPLFADYEEAYHQLMLDILPQQVISTKLVMKDDSVKRIFVDGGFSRNPIYMNLLAESFPGIEVYAASVPQATAMGAALAIHRRWSPKHMPGDLIDLKFYSGNQPGD